MKYLFLFLLSASAWATSVSVPITVTVNDPACTAWTVSGTNITCTSSGPTPPPPSGWPPACANKAMTVVWLNSPHRYLPDSYGGFSPEDVLVVRITPTTATGTQLARIVGAEYQSSPSQRIYTLSPAPCDFTPQPSRGAYNLTGSTSVGVYFKSAAVEDNSGYYPVLQTGKTYYLSIKNVPGSTCFGTGSCDLFLDYSKPSN